jgi:hypothetical protein
MVVSIKNKDSTLIHLPLVPPFVSKEAYLLWKLMTKGERLEQRYEYGERLRLEHGHGPRGSNIEELRRIKILGQKRST